MFAGCVGLFLQFLEGRILLEFFDIVRQVRFFLLDLFFFQSSRDGGGEGWLGMPGNSSPLAVYAPVIDVFFVFSVFFLPGFSAEHCRHIHLVQAFLLAVPIGRGWLDSLFGRLC